MGRIASTSCQGILLFVFPICDRRSEAEADSLKNQGQRVLLIITSSAPKPGNDWRGHWTGSKQNQRTQMLPSLRGLHTNPPVSIVKLLCLLLSLTFSVSLSTHCHLTHNIFTGRLCSLYISCLPRLGCNALGQDAFLGSMTTQIPVGVEEMHE